MAEINVQTKKHSSSPVWLWVLLILIVAAVVYFLIRDKNKNTHTPVNNTTTSWIYTAPLEWKTA